ncbi:MAG TPA: hypothetical protein VHM19_20185 [Polyangiales bacterium]|jgi:hypothetical protein|nr:hypothetical protein [Polyangiales bacterium]
MRKLAASVLLVALCACGASNPYGHAREYKPSDDEESYYDRAHEVSYEEIRRDPQGYAHELVGWFGVVTAFEKQPGGTAKLSLELRFHQPRHMCEDQSEDSCRVTVSERAGGPFTTTVKLPADQVGEGFGSPDRLNTGSLVKVYGEPTGEFDERGGPVLKTEWYRYWPHGTYVASSGSSNTMRR